MNFAMTAICSGIMIMNIPVARFLYSNEFFLAWKYVPPLLISVVFNAMALFIGSIGYKDAFDIYNRWSSYQYSLQCGADSFYGSIWCGTCHDAGLCNSFDYAAYYTSQTCTNEYQVEPRYYSLYTFSCADDGCSCGSKIHRNSSVVSCDNCSPFQK